CVPLTEDLLIELLRRPFRFDAQLARKSTDTDLVLAQGSCPSATLDVESHEHTVHRLLQRVEREKSQRGCHRGVQRTGVPLMAQQLRERVQRQLAQAFTLREEPFLEWRFP